MKLINNDDDNNDKLCIDIHIEYTMPYIQMNK